jgi:catechol 2,3-dioxygenase-like lactoylglutathione lyase family enzyme
MIKDSKPFSGFSVDDLDAARDFYGSTLGLSVTDEPAGLTVELNGGGRVFVYPKGPGHEPASFTVLNFAVEDIDATADELAGKGIEFERYDGMNFDDRGIAMPREGQGPRIAWFKDPAGNILSILDG